MDSGRGWSGIVWVSLTISFQSHAAALFRSAELALEGLLAAEQFAGVRACGNSSAPITSDACEIMTASTPRCLDQRFQRCYPSLRQTVGVDELFAMSRDWRQDPRLRYPTGGGECMIRANALAYTLAERGMAARKLWIEGAPTLIAMDRDGEDRLTGGFYEYMGSHEVIQIMVEVNGDVRPYILDPQFMDRPVPQDEYFTQTMGQVCHEVHQDSGVRLGALDCTFRLHAQNYYYAVVSSTDETYACGWSSRVTKPFWESPPAGHAPSGQLEALNGNADPALVAGLSVREGVQRQLILRSYEQLAVTWREELASIEWQISNLEDRIVSNHFPSFYPREQVEQELAIARAHRDRLRQGLAGLPAKIADVRRTLGL